MTLEINTDINDGRRFGMMKHKRVKNKRPVKNYNNEERCGKFTMVELCDGKRYFSGIRIEKRRKFV